MDEPGIPADLTAFLDAGRALDYDPAECEAGRVSLHPPAALRLQTFGAQCGGTPHEEADPNQDRPGVYRVPGVDLVASCTGDYEPEGLLVWFPGEQSYGVWDSSHDYILTFGPAVTWSQIAESPARFINAQWAFENLDRAPAEFLVPWPRYPHGG
jgi:hypothetical protein